MNIVILGSGVIGTTAAYYLAKSGHQVTVIDRQPGPALEASYANAGEVSPGYSAPWAGPGVPVKAIKWMLMQHSPLVIWPLLDWHMWRWGLAMLRNCTEERYRINKSRMVPSTSTASNWGSPTWSGTSSSARSRPRLKRSKSAHPTSLALAWAR